MASIQSVVKIWDKAEHNAFADLIFFQGSFFCAVREANEHAGGVDGQIRILQSKDGKEWKPVALIELLGVDLRDPMLSEMPDGRLLLSMGGSRYDKEECLGRNPCAAFSTNGKDWSYVTVLDGLPNEWIWRVTWHNGEGYGCSYWSDPNDSSVPWILKLFKTMDALNYIPITQLNIPNNPSEATVRFTSDGTMVALVRRQGPGWIGHAAAPYTEWKWFETEHRMGGPNFLILPDGKMWAGSRLLERVNDEWHCQTALFSMSLNSYQPVVVFPSKGDTSYPGMVYRDGMLYMCYYSTHEEKTSIYFATIDLESGRLESGS